MLLGRLYTELWTLISSFCLLLVSNDDIPHVLEQKSYGNAVVQMTGMFDRNSRKMLEVLFLLGFWTVSGYRKICDIFMKYLLVE